MRKGISLGKRKLKSPHVRQKKAVPRMGTAYKTIATPSVAQGYTKALHKRPQNYFFTTLKVLETP